jgi:hypothetical protein
MQNMQSSPPSPGQPVAVPRLLEEPYNDLGERRRVGGSGDRRLRVRNQIKTCRLHCTVERWPDQEEDHVERGDDAVQKGGGAPLLLLTMLAHSPGSILLHCTTLQNPPSGKVAQVLCTAPVPLTGR